MKKLNSILSNVLGIPESEINDDSSPDNIGSWDSFNGLMLVSELESAYSIKLSLDEVLVLGSVGEIKKVLAKHGVDA